MPLGVPPSGEVGELFCDVLNDRDGEELMELMHLRVIVEGLDSLAEIEKEHPVLGEKLLNFVKDVRDLCKQAYERLSKALGEVRNLPSKPSAKEIDDASATISAAPDSKWFKDVSGICDRLAALATDFDGDLSQQLQYTSPFGENWQESSKEPSKPRFAAHYRIAPLLSLLQKHERDLKQDMRNAVAVMQTKLGCAKTTGDVEDARAYALTIQTEISRGIDEITKLSYQIAGGSSVDQILSPEEIAEQAFRRPERVLILNMFFLIVAFALGAAAFRVIAFYQFVLASGFAFTAVIIINAFYLRTIDKLSEENFLKLIELAILKFFAPLTRRKTKKP
jgi:hypothetical protein